jgi:hypothetical protein
VPQFCRHNRLLANCPICREPEPPAAPRRRSPARSRAAAPGGRGGSAVRVRRVARAVEDGYESPLAPGLHAREDARRLAAELAVAAGRLVELATAPPGLYGEVAAESDPEEALWLAFLIAYLSPLEPPAEGSPGAPGPPDRAPEAFDPFAAIRAVRTRWGDRELPALDGVAGGPRGAHEPARGTATLSAYRRFAQRAGSQAAALGAAEPWPPERRFARGLERLALPGLHRAARFDFLVAAGRTGRLDVRPGSLFLRGAAAGDATALAARRVLGIADPHLLDQRALDLATACAVPLEAVELALWNWQAGPDGRATLGASPAAAEAVDRAPIEAALGLDPA